MDKNKYFSVMDFGSFSLRFSVFDSELNEKFSKTLNKKIYDETSSKFKVINSLVKEAEKKISNHIQDIILILDRSDTLVIDISLSKILDGNIKLSQVYDLLALELNQLIKSYYPEYKIIHTIVGECIINKKNYQGLPKNKIAIDNIKISFKLICFPKSNINNLKNQFKINNLNIINFFCSSYIKTLNYSKKLNKTKISFLEIGYERTNFIFYEKNSLKIFQTIPIGGNHITNDISKIFKINIEKAEKIKQSFNETETEFSYYNTKMENVTAKDIISQNISIDLLKKVILYRVQEIIDLTFKKLIKKQIINSLKDTDLFLIGDGSKLLNSNSFYLNDKFDFKSIKFYSENDKLICNLGLQHYINICKEPKINNKKKGLFERFFNFLGR